MKNLALFALLVAGCYSPNIPNGQQQCSSDNKCPDGYTCGPNHLCYKNGQVPTADMSVAHDMAVAPDDLSTPPDLFRCASDNDCASSTATPRCDTSSGLCVACLPTNDNCAMGSFCDPNTLTCKQGCQVDNDCRTAGDGGTDDGGTSTMACCNHTCVDTSTDKGNCGACGTQCQGNTGTCCASKCVDTTTDATNCGGCGMACSTANITAACSASQCTGTCATGFADCNNDKRTDGCEVDTTTDAKNCGGCGMACSSSNMATVTCGGGVCNGTCVAGFADCNSNKLVDGCEQNIASDASNCGACGKACSSNNMATVSCGGGVCNGGCKTGFADCNNNKLTDGCEINTASDASNCGACGKACSSTNMATISCGGGVCNGTCKAGFADCNNNKLTDGCETNISGDPNNCGGCGVVCSGNNVTSRTCGGGVCNGGCVAGFSDCNNNKQVDGCEARTPVACTTGTDPETGAPWVTCGTATCAQLQVSANTSGSYHALQICKLLGYSQLLQQAGTCGGVCSAVTTCPQPASSCSAPSTPVWSGAGACGSDTNGPILCSTVTWLCGR